MSAVTASGSQSVPGMTCEPRRVSGGPGSGEEGDKMSPERPHVGLCNLCVLATADSLVGLPQHYFTIMRMTVDMATAAWCNYGSVFPGLNPGNFLLNVDDSLDQLSRIYNVPKGAG